MNTVNYNISLNYSQIFDLVRQLPMNQKIRLTQELAKETLDIKLSELLSIFKTDELDEDIINNELDIVRAELYAQK